jgi:cytochrome c553
MKMNNSAQTHRRLRKVALALALLVCSFGAQAGDPAAGKEKSVVCQACHGPTGMSIDPIYPHLAGQHADYLEHALKGYRSGERNNVIMAGFAATLSDDDIADLAAWFASQDGLRDLSK